MIIKYYYDNKLPILGICRGIQLLNVFRGGTLYQDIPSQYKGEITIPHRIKKNGRHSRVIMKFRSIRKPFSAA